MPDKQGDLVRIMHIVDAINEIKEYINDLDFDDFKNQSVIINASIRLLITIGEASNHTSKELKNNYPQIEWSEIIGLRNILIHQYFGVDIRVVWDIINEDLVDLESNIIKIIKDLKKK